MAIKGMGTRLQRIYNIKIGMKGKPRKSSKGKDIRTPIKFDHFVVTTMDRDANDDFIPAADIMDKLGEKPTELDVFLPYDSIEAVFPTRVAHWTQSRLHCTGDREIAEKIHEDGTREEIECPCDLLKQKICKPNGILNVVLPQAGRIGGVAQFRTGSWNSIENILSSLGLIQSLTGGILAGIQLRMKIGPKRVQPTDGSKGRTVQVVGIEYIGDITDLRIAAGQEAGIRQVSGVDRNLLEAEARSLSVDLPADAKDWEQEFGGGGDDEAHPLLPEQAESASKPTAESKPAAKSKPTGENKPAEKPSTSASKPDPEAEEKAAVIKDIKGLCKQLPKTGQPTVTKWLEKDHSLTVLKSNRTILEQKIAKYGQKGAAKKTAPTSTSHSDDTSTLLMDIMQEAVEHGLIAEDDAADLCRKIDDNTSEWIGEQISEWQAKVDQAKINAENSGETAPLPFGEGSSRSGGSTSKKKY